MWTLHSVNPSYQARAAPVASPILGPPMSPAEEPQSMRLQNAQTRILEFRAKLETSFWNCHPDY